MELHFELSQNQISQIAKMLCLNLDEIKNYLETHQEEQQEDTEDKQKTNDNSLWTVYTDDTVCNVKLDNKYIKEPYYTIDKVIIDSKKLEV